MFCKAPSIKKKKMGSGLESRPLEGGGGRAGHWAEGDICLT